MTAKCREENCKQDVSSGGIYCYAHNRCGFKGEGKPSCGKFVALIRLGVPTTR